MTLNLARNYILNEYINKLIQDEKPDIIALQEAVHAQPDATDHHGRIPPEGSRIVPKIAEKFGYQYSFGYAANTPPTDETRYWGPAILSKFKFLESTRISLAQRRRALVKVQIQPDRSALTCYSTHLPAGWYRRYGLSYTAIYEAYTRRKEIISLIMKEIGDNPKHTILAGDFNSIPLLNEVELISKTMNDAFLVKGKGHGSTYHAFLPFARVDYIFTSRDIEILGSWVSDAYQTLDHRAVVADIILN
ncbi:MAG: endonuclease/exonuclease/phosphatase family protein [Spirochaetes bacterium]|nr:endonuclease/exonuclease/phosphatase family protein [Spirochaetota bacterium]